MRHCSIFWNENLKKKKAINSPVNALLDYHLKALDEKRERDAFLERQVILEVPYY